MALTLTAPIWGYLFIPRLVLDMAYQYKEFEDSSFSHSGDLKEDPNCSKNTDDLE